MAEPTESESTNAPAAATMKGQADDSETQDRIALQPPATDHMCRWYLNTSEGSVCNTLWTTVEELVTHIFKEHLKTRPSLGRKQQDRPKCQWQGCVIGTFRDRSHLVLHIRSHTGERPYKCNHPGCDQAFRRGLLLRDHKVTHIEGKYFDCPNLGCSKRFNSIGALRFHRRGKHLRTERASKTDQSLPNAAPVTAVISSAANTAHATKQVGSLPNTAPSTTTAGAAPITS
eukprot:scpid97363/ scgid12500/ Zinc finger protein ZIC 4; Zinc finger protein of the cerebellum 4